MPTVTWPSTLPLPLSDGYGETPPNNILTWKADFGPTHTRLRGTGNSRFLSLKYRFSISELSTFDTFLLSTTIYGVLPFNFTHPRTLTTVSAIFDYLHGDPVDYSNLQNTGVVGVRLEILA